LHVCHAPVAPAGRHERRFVGRVSHELVSHCDTARTRPHTHAHAHAHAHVPHTYRTRTAPHRTAPHRTAPRRLPADWLTSRLRHRPALPRPLRRTAPHRTAPHHSAIAIDVVGVVRPWPSAGGRGHMHRHSTGTGGRRREAGGGRLKADLVTLSRRGTVLYSALRRVGI
jgi:hypothetical protein